MKLWWWTTHKSGHGVTGQLLWLFLGLLGAGGCLVLTLNFFFFTHNYYNFFMFSFIRTAYYTHTHIYIYIYIYIYTHTQWQNQEWREQFLVVLQSLQLLLYRIYHIGCLPMRTIHTPCTPLPTPKSKWNYCKYWPIINWILILINI